MWAEGSNPRASTLSRSTTQASDQEFNWMRNQALGENPYAEPDDDDDDGDSNTLVNSIYPSGSTAAGSSGSLGNRSRTNTMDSMTGRMPPRQFPMGAQAPLHVQTNYGQGAQSPGHVAMDSYFSPTSESPVSTRSSGQLSMQSGMYPFPRQPVPNVPNGFEDSNRFTAPAMPRQGSRDLNGYQNRGAQRPSLPPSMNSAQNARMRSASSPDIQNPVGPRRLPDPNQPGVPDMPAFPAHYAYQPGIVGRQGNGSPASMAHHAQQHVGLPLRPNTQSPGIQQQRERMGGPPRSMPQVGLDYQGGQYAPPLNRAITNIDRIGTPGSIDARMMEPPTLQHAQSYSHSRTQTPPSILHNAHHQHAPASPPQNQQTPTQLKVKVAYAAGAFTTTLVVPLSISYDLLKDRIDAKLSRTSSVSLGSGAVKLKYVDEGDYISIQNDEDVQEAFEIWREQSGMGPGMAEVQLFVQ